MSGRLEEYWGVGPKTRERLEAELGTGDAVAAIEAADSRALVEAGIPRGRAVRILRRANGGDGMELLATSDARAVYRELLAHVRDHAVTGEAADRIHVLTPLRSRAAMEDRLDDVFRAVDSWAALDDDDRETALAAFAAYDEAGGGERAAVETALDLRDAGLDDGVFAPLAESDADALAAAADALAHLADGSVREGADDRLDALRDRLASLERMDANAGDVLETVRSGDVRGTEAFQEEFVRHVTRETAASLSDVREAMPGDAADAEDFVRETLRSLVADAREAVAEREETVAAELRATVESARADVDAAASAVSDVAFHVSLARFALAHDLVRPEFVDGDALAVVGARNLSLSASGEDVQPVTYAVGDHDLAADPGPPSGDRVTVLTGANSGGKTTLLETLCEVALLAQMGLPVPADAAQVSVVDTVVFHRRHASFNAGVLESTLRTIVPPLSNEGRTLMLVDEFEAITEPGSAADLLHGLVTLTVDRRAIGAFVTHLAEDLEPLPDEARVDGIFAEGLDPDLALRVDYQPRFGSVGKSTPEFIVSRLVANASDREDRAGFEHLAGAVGEEAVQRTLADVEWSD